MKIAIILNHPNQFDVPIFRLAPDIIDVIYTDHAKIESIYDPEVNRKVSWDDQLTGYRFEVVPPKGKLSWIYKKLKAGRYDLVITNGYFNRTFIASLMLGKLFSRHNAIRLDTVGFNNASVFKRMSKFLLYRVLDRLVTKFFVVGTLSRHFLNSNGIKDQKISYFGYVSNNSFFRNNLITDANHLSRLRKKYNVPDDKTVILCISKHNEREAPIDTLRAFGKLNDSSLHLLLVGDGPLNSFLKEQAKDLEITNVSFVGYLDFKLLPECYSIANVFVHDSHNEPWGVSVQEAISCNVAVVASDKVGAAYDLVKHGRNGFVYTAGDIDALAKNIKAALLLKHDVLQETNEEILHEWNYEKVLATVKDIARDGL